MGREIRRVPPTWQHPTYGDLHQAGIGVEFNPRTDDVHPMRDCRYEDAAAEWLSNALLWERGEHPDQKEYPDHGCKYYWDWHGPCPDKAYYRSGKWDFQPEEATAYQVYENVTEGTPVSPVLKSEEAILEWLVKNNFTFERAKLFIQEGWMPSVVILAPKSVEGKH